MTKVEKQEVAVNENQTNEVVNADNSRITENYEILKNAQGKYQRKAIYTMFSSIKPETKEEKIKMLQLLDSDEIAQPLGEHIGARIELADVIFNPYDKVDEDTGEMEYGVLSYLITPEGVAYVTSSKSVYHTLQNAFKVFGYPHYEGEDVLTVESVKKKGQNHQYTDIKIIG